MAKTELFSRQASGGLIVVGDDYCSGDIFFVNATGGVDAAGYGKTPDAPTATIDYAVGLCTASKGDRIYVMPGHTESITAATSLVVDVQGISIIGLGTGSLRPTLTFTTAATANISVTAADVTLKNLLLISDFSTGVTAGITAGASAGGFTLDGIEMRETTSDKEFLIGVYITALCDDVTIKNFRFVGAAGGTDSSCIFFAGNSDRLTLVDNVFFGDWSASVVDHTTTASYNCKVANNVGYNVDAEAGLWIGFNAGTTGFNIENHAYTGTDGGGLVVGTIIADFDSYHTNVLTASGFLTPAVDS